MHLPSLAINKKVLSILIGMSVSFFIIAVRLVYLQIYCCDYFQFFKCSQTIYSTKPECRQRYKSWNFNTTITMQFHS